MVLPADPTVLAQVRAAYLRRRSGFWRSQMATQDWENVARQVAAIELELADYRKLFGAEMVRLRLGGRGFTEP